MQRTINKTVSRVQKIFLLFLLLSLIRLAAYACDGCSVNQPRILRSISHGTGPDSKWDIWIVALAAASVVLTLFYSVKWLVAPGEKSKDHIKNLVLTSQ